MIPANLRRIFGLQEGSLVIAEQTADGILLRPALTLPIELYSAADRAAFLLSDAVDDEDYQKACEEVRMLGIDPDTVPHSRP